MGWEDLREDDRAKGHHCRKPRLGRRVGVGSVWRCDECGTRWIVAENDLMKPALKVWRRAGDPPTSWEYLTRG